MSWRNWAGNVTAEPATVLTPRSLPELAEEVRAATPHRPIRPIGAGHSFTAIAEPVHTQVRMDAFMQVEVLDAAAGIVRVGAGTQLGVMNRRLWDLGFAMPNLGDIDQQTISGAIATGTHGTGSTLRGLADAVVGATLVTPAGVMRIDAATNAELLPAMRVNLGALGIVADVDLDVVPRYRLRAVEQPEPLAAVLDDLDGLVDEHRHFEFYWFPHTDRTLTKRNDIADPADPGRPLGRFRGWLDDDFLSNTVFEGLNRVVARRPSLARRINSVSARALSARTFTAPSFEVFCTRRDVRFTESEFAFPRAALPSVLADLRTWLDSHDEHIAFPVEVRFAAPDEAWLSTAYQRASAYVAVHQYWRRDHTRYFNAFWDIARAHEGRPHWGKMHDLSADELADLYPRYQDFIALRDRLDPERVLTNPYLDRVLAACL